MLNSGLLTPSGGAAASSTERARRGGKRRGGGPTSRASLQLASAEIATSSEITTSAEIASSADMSGGAAAGAAAGGIEARQGGRLPGRLWPSVEAREHWRGFAQRAATSAQQAHALHCLRDHAAAFGLMGKKEARAAMDRCSLQWRLTEDAGWA